MMDSPRRFLLFTLALLLWSVACPAQPPQGSAREQMWPAPTKEDWQKPYQITWQRTWEDAVAVSRATKKAILICVNMDGEIASEHYAGIRYRDPEIAKLYEPYVCVIASTYRHTPRDYDENGQRVPCPRFGGVTCGEHIDIEPILYEKYFDGRRIAPRHIMIELDGEETYDIFYANDTASVFQAISDGISKRTVKPLPQVKGDRSIIERVASPDVADRMAVEKAFEEGDDELKHALLQAAAKLGDEAPLQLLRLALASFDESLNAEARKTLAATNSTASTDVIADALRAQMSPEEKEALIKALDRLGKESPQAKTLALVHRGLGSAGSVNAKAWSGSLNSTEEARQAYEQSVQSRLERQTELADSEEPAALLDVAEAQLSRAIESPSEGRSQRMVRKAMFEDARRNALKAESLGAEGWRPNEILAVIAYYQGESDEAKNRAIVASKFAPADASSWNSMVVLWLVGEQRRQQISDAVRDRKEWPKEWLADLNAAYAILARHPYGNDEQVAAHYDFMMWLRAFNQAESTLESGLGRFPNSWVLHDRLRGRLLRRRGADGIEDGYREYLAREDVDKAAFTWFAGYGSLVAAEFHRRANRDEKALAAYDRGIAFYEKAKDANQDWETSADHYIAMAHGGRARVAFEAKDDKLALDELLLSFKLSPDSAATLDGLNISAVDTAKMLRSRFEEQKKRSMLKILQDALDALDPAMLQLPAYEGQTRPNIPARGQGGGNRRNN